MRKILIAIAFAVFAASSAKAGGLKTEADARALADNVMASVGSGDIRSGFEMMKPYLSLSGTEVDSVYLQTKLTRDQYKDRFGGTVATEFISSKTIGSSLVRYLYVERTENTAFVWKFIFYKTKDGWVINSFNWGDIAKELNWD